MKEIVDIEVCTVPFDTKILELIIEANAESSRFSLTTVQALDLIIQLAACINERMN